MILSVNARRNVKMMCTRAIAVCVAYVCYLRIVQFAAPPDVSGLVVPEALGGLCLQSSAAAMTAGYLAAALSGGIAGTARALATGMGLVALLSVSQQVLDTGGIRSISIAALVAAPFCLAGGVWCEARRARAAKDGIVSRQA